MRGDLSHGLPELITSGNRILRADNMQPVLLRGVNRSGLEYTEPSAAGFLAAAQLTRDEVREIVTTWRSNVIRLPFNQHWALNGRQGHSAEEYLAALDQVIAWAAALGAYTILDLQWLDAETIYGHTNDRRRGKQDNHVPPTPNVQTIDLWKILALRYRTEPAVLFDLFNEPHDPLRDDFLPIHLINPDGEVMDSDRSFVAAGEWVPWARRLVEEVRRIRNTGLILIGGVDWAFDLRGIYVDAPNIVYSAHIYANRKPGMWWKALGRADVLPVYIAEWGGTAKDIQFGRKLADLMRQKGLGWTAWSWVDDPQLVRPPGAPEYEPTAFGRLVQEELRA